MSKSFEEALSHAKALSHEEQLALISLLSQMLAEETALEKSLSEKEEQTLLNRIAAYEQGRTPTIPGDSFREELLKKYGY